MPIKHKKLDFSSKNPGKLQADKPSGNKTKLTVATFGQYSGFIVPAGPIYSESIRLALNSIRQAQLLDKYELTFEFHDDYCDHGYAVKYFAEFLEFNSTSKTASEDNLLPIVAGPVCAHQAYVGPLLRHYNFVGVAQFSTAQPVFSQRSFFSSFHSILPSFEIFTVATPHFIKSQGWSKVFLLTETYPFWEPLERQLQDNLAAMNITLAGTFKVITLPGVIPEPELFENAVKELASRDPRIIIFHTDFPAIAACWLHRYGLRGPKHVFIMVAWSYFSPKTVPRAEGCTDHSLFEMIKSVFYYNFDSPVNKQEDIIDSTGTSVTSFVAAMKSRIESPELQDVWFYFQGLYYDQSLAIAYILNATEAELNIRNETLLDWIVGSQSFVNKGSTIHHILNENAANIDFDGVTVRRPLNVNGRTGPATFYQMQTENPSDLESDLAKLVKPVYVARYDNLKQEITILKTDLKWGTEDGMAPYDRVVIVEFPDKFMKQDSEVAIISISASLIAMCLTLMVANERSRRTVENIKRSAPSFNSLLLGGVLVLCVSNLAFPYITSTPHINCSASAVLLIIGYSIVIAVLLAKLSAAHRLANSGSIIMNLSQIPPISFARVPTTSRRPETTKSSFIHVSENLTRSARREAYFIVTSLTLVQFILVVIWVALQPIEMFRFDRQTVISSKHSSIIYQYFTEICKFDTRSSSPVILAAFSGVFFGVALLRILSLSFLLRRHNFEHLNDLGAYRVAGLALAVVIVAGCVVIGAFYSNSDPAAMQVAVSTLTILVSALTMSIVFLPKRKYLRLR